MGLFSFISGRKQETPRQKAIREAVGRFEKRLTESFQYYDQLADPYAYYRDVTQDFFPVAGGLANRSRERINETVLSEGQLRVYRGLARWTLENNPYAQGIIRNLRNFVIRRGFTFRPAQELEGSEQVQLAIDRFTRRDRWVLRQQEFFTRAVRDGEVFLRRGKRDGKTTIRFIEPEQVVNPPDAGPEWHYGIKCDPEDAETPVAYYVTDLNNTAEGEEVPAEEILHYKRNVDLSIRRGLSDFFSLRDDFEGLDRLLRNTREGAAVQAAIAFIREHDMAAESAVEDFIAGRREFMRFNPTNGKRIDYERFEPGSIVDVGKSLKFQPPPSAGNYPAYIQVIQACVRAILTRWAAPEFFSSDASNANYASTLVAGSPFIENVKTEQAELVEVFRQVMAWVMEDEVALGRVPAAALNQDLQIEPPEPTMVDPLQQAQVFQIASQNKWISPQTVQQKMGWDSDTEQENLEDWEARHGPAMPPMPGAGGMPSMESAVVESACECGGKCGACQKRLKECDQGPNKGKPGPCPDANNEEQPKQDKSESWLALANKVPAKVLNVAKANVAQKYEQLSARYGPRYAKAILAAGIAGIPLPIPGSSILTAAPVIAVAELHRQLSGGPKEPAVAAPGSTGGTRDKMEADKAKEAERAAGQKVVATPASQARLSSMTTISSEGWRSIADRLKATGIDKAESADLQQAVLRSPDKKEKRKAEVELKRRGEDVPKRPNQEAPAGGWRKKAGKETELSPGVLSSHEIDANEKSGHDALIAAGAKLKDESESGSRYYEMPDGTPVRLSDHAPNEATDEWIERTGAISIRTDKRTFAKAIRQLSSKTITASIAEGEVELTPEQIEKLAQQFMKELMADESGNQ